MKILVATPLYPPESGGPATYSKLLEHGLPARGIEVELVKFGAVRRLPRLVRHAVYFFRVLSAARRADGIYALDAVSVGLPAMLAAKCMGKPFAVKIVGDFAWEQGRQRYGVDMSVDAFARHKAPFPLRLFQMIQTSVARRARIVVVPSEYLKGIVQAWGIPAAHITVIWNAIEQETGGAVPGSVGALPRPLVVGVGRLVPWKGFGELIQALALVRKENIPVSLALAGDGPDRAFLESVAREKLDGNYIFTGTLAHRDACAVIASADVFVLDSQYEGLSHVLIEALLSGACVVVSDIGGNRELIEHEKNGLLVPPGSTRALAEALKRVLTDEALRARLGTAAKEMSARLSPQVMFDATARTLQQLL